MKKLLYITLVTLLFSSCTKKTTTTDELPTPTQNLQGFVYLYNQFGQYQQSYAGVTVSLDSTSYTATTDSTGAYTLKNVPAGYYSITYSKPGYGTYKRSYFEYLADKANQLTDVNLYQNSTSSITNLKLDSVVYSPTNYGIELTGTISSSASATQYANFILFVGTSPAVSPGNYAQVYTTSGFNNISTSFNYLFTPYSTLSAGQTIYIVVYGIAATSNSYYVNPATGKYIYTSLGSTPSNVASIVLP